MLALKMSLLLQCSVRVGLLETSICMLSTTVFMDFLQEMWLESFDLYRWRSPTVFVTSPRVDLLCLAFRTWLTYGEPITHIT